MCPKKNFNNKQFDESSTSTFLAYKETPDLPNQYWCPSDYGGKAKIDYKRDHKLIPLLTIVIDLFPELLMIKALFYNFLFR